MFSTVYNTSFLKFLWGICYLKKSTKKSVETSRNPVIAWGGASNVTLTVIVFHKKAPPEKIFKCFCLENAQIFKRTLVCKM